MVRLILIVLMALGAGLVSAQGYPAKPMRIVTAPPGGGNDLAARMIAIGLAGAFGQQVTVDNRPSGVIVVDAVTKAPPDGYTLLLYSDGLWLLPLLQKVPYDPVRDLSSITMVGNSPSVLAVHPALPAKSVKELIVLAKARPGELNYAISAVGGNSHLQAELFKSMTGIKMVGVNYKGGGLLVTALMSGEVQLSFATGPSIAPHVKSGRIKALAVTSAQPSVLFPGMPTVAASGLPGFEAGTLYSAFAPAKTAAAIIAQLNREIASVLNVTETRSKLLDGGIEAVTSTPEQLAAKMSSEMMRMGKVVRDAGIRID